MFRGMLMRVDDVLAGAPLDGTLEILQYAVDGGIPLSIGHLRPLANAKYLLVVAPSPHVAGFHQLELDFDTEFYGWGAERPDGTFRVPVGPRAIERQTVADGVANRGGLP